MKTAAIFVAYTINRSSAPFPGVDWKKAVGLTMLTWENFLVGNLLPVTMGNVICGPVSVAAIYWFIYLRKPRSDPR